VGGAAGYGKVDKAESLVGPSGAAGSGNVAPTDPLSPAFMEIARQVKSGQISREEAHKKIVDKVLEERMRLKSKALSKAIVDQMQVDPRMNQAMDRVLGKG
jgi:hypothetical protein